jgi:hypothetical protein
MKTVCRFCSKHVQLKPHANKRTLTCEGCRKINHRFRKTGRDHIMLTTWFVNQIQECVECGSKEKLTIDRIVPASMGGEYEQGNIQILCYECNCCKKIASESVEDGLKDDKEKTCGRCGKTKQLNTSFWHKTHYISKYKLTKSMFHPVCKVCRNEIERIRWKKGNRAAIEASRRYYDL